MQVVGLCCKVNKKKMKKIGFLLFFSRKPYFGNSKVEFLVIADQGQQR
jgi:hypothetical protein